MASKGSGESCNKASLRHKTYSHQHQGQTKYSLNSEHQPSNHDAVATYTEMQHGTQSSSSTQALKASTEKSNFLVITTAEWMIHDKFQRWMEEDPGEEPWNSVEASSTEMKDQGINESGQQDKN